MFSFKISLDDDKLFGKRIGLFSYGSGTASSMFSILVRSDHESRILLRRIGQDAKFTLSKLCERTEVSPREFNKVLSDRERNHHIGSTDCIYSCVASV